MEAPTYVPTLSFACHSFAANEGEGGVYGFGFTSGDTMLVYQYIVVQMSVIIMRQARGSEATEAVFLPSGKKASS